MTSLALLPNGKLVIGGDFTEVNGQAHNHIARINLNGSLDSGFDADINDRVFALILQPDGKLLVGGRFTQVNGRSANHVARLNADGSVDLAFNAFTNDDVMSMALQTDGKIIVAGSFSEAGAENYGGIARLNADGSLDSGFNASTGDSVREISLQVDGKLLTTRHYTPVQGNVRDYLVRLGTSEPVELDLQLITNGIGDSRIFWLRSGPGPELALPPGILFSIDGDHWATIGTMNRVDGGWAFEGFVPPQDTTFYLRAQGQVSVGGKSSSLIESTRQFYLTTDDFDDTIFANGFD